MISRLNKERDTAPFPTGGFFSSHLTGKQAEKSLENVGMPVNKNTIPYEVNSPMVTGGIRLRTPALTSAEMGEEQMKTIASCICDVLDAIQEENIRSKIKAIGELTRRFPLYQSRMVQDSDVSGRLPIKWEESVHYAPSNTYFRTI